MYDLYLVDWIYVNSSVYEDLYICCLPWENCITELSPLIFY